MHETRKLVEGRPVGSGSLVMSISTVNDSIFFFINVAWAAILTWAIKAETKRRACRKPVTATAPPLIIDWPLAWRGGEKPLHYSSSCGNLYLPDIHHILLVTFNSSAVSTFVCWSKARGGHAGRPRENGITVNWQSGSGSNFTNISCHTDQLDYSFHF